jgi:hypothetical protein
VQRTTSANVAPAAVRTWPTFSSVSRVSSAIVPTSRSRPTIADWPDTNTNRPSATMPGLYGPPGSVPVTGCFTPVLPGWW